MKRLSFSLFLILSIGAKAIEYPNLKPQPNIINGKTIPNVKPILGDYLYIGETEVSNGQYQLFLNWLKKNKPEEYFANLPDTTQWRKNFTYGEPYVDYYFRHPAYKNYPLVNISQKQAANYCIWLHDSLARYFVSKKSTIDKFIVRLPTEKEWMMAARGGLPETSVYPWEGDEIRKYNKKGGSYIQLNCKMNYSDYSGSLSGGGFITTMVKSYWPNGFGLYNMSGNVAEWIAEPAKSKGGSWSLPPYNARIDAAGYYDGDTMARPDIGFRYIIEIISVKDEFKPVSFNSKYFKKSLSYIPWTDTSNKHYHFAFATEVTNAEYNTFLKENNLPEFQIANENWNQFFHYKYFEMYGWHSGYSNFPVVNISYKAALAYCEWLTKKYNDLENKTYKKVIFKLPTEKEWEDLAKGGNNFMYPWGGPYCRNSKGCYLANFCPLEEQYIFKTDSATIYKYPNDDFRVSRGIDGSIIPSNVDSYFPNDYGLYNCSGNVAEMVSEYGITKGGSWNSNNHYIQIRSNEKYTEPSPTIGFRVLMEVLEK